MSKRLGGIIGCKDKAASWHLISYILDARLVDVPAGVIQQEESHAGFLIHLPSALLALIFIARRDSAVPFPRRP